MTDIARALTPEADELPDALADVARALGEALAQEWFRVNAQNAEGKTALGIRNAAPPAGSNQKDMADTNASAE